MRQGTGASASPGSGAAGSGGDDFQISVSDSFYHISYNDGDTWDNFDIVEQEIK